MSISALHRAPLRAVAAEAAIKGKRIDEDGAAEAAKIAVAEVQPLSMNQYKVDIARTLIKRAILACG